MVINLKSDAPPVFWKLFQFADYHARRWNPIQVRYFLEMVFKFPFQVLRLLSVFDLPICPV